MSLPKVGPKTADVLLSVWGRPTVSVDTHFGRVARRLGLAPDTMDYEKLRSAVLDAFPESEYRNIPLLFMAFGRRICKAKRPLCPTCPVGALCSYPEKTTGLSGEAADGT